MYKFSIFFQFIFRDEKLIILFPENRYSLKINQEEQQKLEKFFYNFLDKNFSQKDYETFCDFDRYKQIFTFLLKIQVFSLIEEQTIFDTLILSKISYNPSILDNFPNFEKIKNIYKKRFSQKENKNIINNQNGVVLDLLKNRKTYRKYKKSIFNLDEIRYLLQCSYWNIFLENNFWNQIIHKTVPSGWWFFALKIYFFLFFDEKVELFCFDWVDLFSVGKKFDKKIFLQDCIIYNPDLDFDNCTWFVVILADIDLVVQKYSVKSYPLLLLEWWHISQNFVLASIEKWYGTCELWWVFEEKLLQYCQIDDKKMIFINSILFWKI